MLSMDADYADQSSVNIFRFSGGCASLVAMVSLSIDAGSSETTFNSSWNCKVLPWRVAHADQSSVNNFRFSGGGASLVAMVSSPLHVYGTTC